MLEGTVKFAISNDFFDSYVRLPQRIQTKVNRFLDKFRQDPAAPGHHYETIKNAADARMRSARVDDTYRAIVLKPERGDVYIVLWVDHHDDADRWAQSRRCEINPATGSLQLIDTETLGPERAPVPADAAVRSAATGLFDDIHDRHVLRFGVPEGMMPRVRRLTTEAELDRLAQDLPTEAAQALYALAAGDTVEDVYADQAKSVDRPVPVDPRDVAAALDNPESRQRFYVVETERELALMLNAPLERWRVFLHPSQRRIVERHWNGPVRVLGGAGTGKTVVAMHRANWLAQRLDPNRQILFTTFTRNLAADIQENLRQLCAPDVLARIEVINLNAWVTRFLRTHGYTQEIVYDTCALWDLALTLAPAAPALPKSFYREEWDQIIRPRAIGDAHAYARVSRIGRGTSLTRRDRIAIWPVFEEFRALMVERGLREFDEATRDARRILETEKDILPYRHVIVDEAQDMGDEAFLLIRQMIPDGDRTDDLFIVGDAHQRIYRRSVTLGRCGINIKGRGQRLRLNYRCTEETRRWAQSILSGLAIDDLDGGTDDSKGYRSLLHGVEPRLKCFSDAGGEIEGVSSLLAALDETTRSATCIVARTQSILDRYEQALSARNLEYHKLKRNEPDRRDRPGVRLATMHRVKGLQFDTVIIVSVNEGIVPLSAALDDASDPRSRDNSEAMERRLLFVAATRARREVHVFSHGQ